MICGVFFVFVSCFLIFVCRCRTSIADELREEIYEVDADQDRIDEEMSRSQADTITKQGYLMKGPDTTSDRMFAHIGSKSFKRR